MAEGPWYLVTNMDLKPTRAERIYLQGMWIEESFRHTIALSLRGLWRGLCPRGFSAKRFQSPELPPRASVFVHLLNHDQLVCTAPAILQV